MNGPAAFMAASAAFMAAPAASTPPATETDR